MRMIKVRLFFSGMLAVLAVLLLTGCGEKDNPVRTSLDVDTSTMRLAVGESAVRMAYSKAEDATITYTSSKPAVATVDQFGKVTAMSEGSATITIEMAETKKSWYAAKTITYEVVVKNVSAQAVANVDKATPLTLVAQADGKITVTFNNGITLANDIKYTINGGAEQTIAKNTSGAYDITVKKGDVVQLYSLNSSLGGSTVAGARGTTRAVDDGAKYINIRPSMKTEIYGNVMSLLKGKDNLESATTIEANNAFYGLFAGADKLVNNTERLLVLPATTLTEGCYQDMFNGCKGIEKAPELPAPKLEKNCYQEMFYDCAKLNHVKCLASDIKAENSTKDWLGKAGTEATGEKVLETLVPMTANSDDGVPTSWTAQKIVAVTGIELDADEMKLSVGGVGTLKATVEPTDATEKTITWTSSNTSVATVDANGNVTGVAAGTATITAQAGDKTATCVVTVTAGETYLKWDDGQTELVATPFPATYNTVSSVAGGVSWTAGTYVVEDDVTISGTITLTGDVDLIIKDGAKLTAKQIYGSSSKYNLSIYGQANKTGQLVVNCSNDQDAITCITILEVHSAKVTATSPSAGCSGFYEISTFNVYGGSVDGENTGSDGYGIFLARRGSMNIYGDVKAVGKGDYYGIYGGSSSTVTVYDGKLWAENADKKAIDFGNVTLTTGAGYTGTIRYSSDKTMWSGTANPDAKYVKVEKSQGGGS